MSLDVIFPVLSSSLIPLVFRSRWRVFDLDPNHLILSMRPLLSAWIAMAVKLVEKISQAKALIQVSLWMHRQMHWAWRLSSWRWCSSACNCSTTRRICMRCRHSLFESVEFLDCLPRMHLSRLRLVCQWFLPSGWVKCAEYPVVTSKFSWLCYCGADQVLHWILTGWKPQSWCRVVSSRLYYSISQFPIDSWRWEPWTAQTLHRWPVWVEDFELAETCLSWCLPSQVSWDQVQRA